MISTKQLRDELGVSYRMVTYWAQQGWIPGQTPVGPGNHREWSDEQAMVLRRAMELNRVYGVMIDRSFQLAAAVLDGPVLVKTPHVFMLVAARLPGQPS